MNNFILFISLTILTIGPILVWPSRYNVPMLLNVGFVFVAYFVPLIMLSDNENYSGEVFDLFYKITVLGAFAYLLGLIIGYLVPLIRMPLSFVIRDNEFYQKRFIKLTQIFLIIGVAGMLLSYLLMGFVPAFASDPLNAKFFRGAYEAPYMRVAVLYRISNLILINALGFGFILVYIKRTFFNISLVILASCVLLSTLNRGTTAFALLTVIGLVCADKGRLYSWLFVIFNSFTIIIGSISYYIIGLIFGIDQFTDLYSEDSLWTLIASGAPDISDQLQFLKMYLLNPELTYGKTFLGGLIPGHYQWNPSVWALKVISPDTDLNDITSGGLRLPVSIWGYTAFSWLGVIAVSLISGLIMGYFTKYLKHWIKSGSMSKNIVAITFYSLIGIQLSGFYVFSYMFFPPLIVLFFYVFILKK
ncbi:oligosaccharide repeat unit polymerase [Mucilaginibacter sp. P25]|uniref:Oligosaccharide repeat unit polymerase n=1 Tax=Mucilaginibacter gossypii TaxID=551996 RepID=A0A1G7PMI0_9SPHI|nr:oligosaccharide repeat unit polymerase [Mucilaginibacter gossypii]SDF86869.1 hypothetical protein SAMN05192573_101593 [Mucilaginibacter gossypii]